MQGRLYGAFHDPARVAAAGGRRRCRELLCDGLEGRALHHLLDQLGGTVQCRLLAADPAGLDENFANQILFFRCRFGGLAQGRVDRRLADPRAALEATTDQLGPAHLGTDLFPKRGRADPALGEEFHVGRRRGTDFLGHRPEFLIDLFIGDHQVLELGQFLSLKALVNQQVQGLLLNGGNVFRGRLDLSHSDQQQHALAQIEARDHAVVDSCEDAVRHLERRRSRCGCGCCLGCRIECSRRGRNLHDRRGLRRGRTGQEGGHRNARHKTRQTHISPYSSSGVGPDMIRMFIPRAPGPHGVQRPSLCQYPVPPKVARFRRT